jgi:heme-degrading monooxygenase HmoA
VIVRIWRTGIDEARADEYERFASERSLAMFQRREGCLGVLFTHAETGRAVISLWTDRAAVDRLESDREYQATVAAILEAGFLRSPQVVETFGATGGWLSEAVQKKLRLAA